MKAADIVGLPLTESAVRTVNQEADRRFLGDVYQYHGRTPDFWELRDKWAIERLGVTSSKQEYFDAIQGIFNDYSLIRVYPEVRTVLGQVKESGHELGIISNFNDALLKVLRYHRLDSFFSSVTYSQAVGAEKPDPRIFAYALSQTGSSAHSSVHIGDSWECDYLGARSAGLRAIWLNREAQPAPGECDQVRDLTGILPILAAVQR